jgi:hypothetical protein
MGQEIAGSAELKGRTIRGKVLLETDEILFRGDERIRIPFVDIKQVSVDDGRLVVRYKGGTVTFDIGAAASRWANRIRKPPTLADKLGVKPGQCVGLVGVDDPGLVSLLVERGADVCRGRLRKASDLIVLRVQRPRDLEELASLEVSLARDGAIWVVYPKGRRDPSEVDVIEAGKAAGFVDVKVARFSDTHTALKFMIPKARR